LPFELASSRHPPAVPIVETCSTQAEEGPQPEDHDPPEGHMREILPVLLGCSLGGLGGIRLPQRLRAVLIPLSCVGAGAAASAINGELSSDLWAVFVSVDSLLVWMGAALGTAAFWLFGRFRTAA
jgi:hypothetical protein